MRGLSPVVASGGHSSSRCAGLSLSRPLLLRSTGSRRAGSVVVAYGPSCSAACGIFPDQGLNPCPLHWQADSQPLHHQGSPEISFFLFFFDCYFNYSINYLKLITNLITHTIFWMKFLSQGVKVGNCRPWMAVPEPTLKKKPGRPEDKDFKNTLRFLNV